MRRARRSGVLQCEAPELAAHVLVQPQQLGADCARLEAEL